MFFVLQSNQNREQNKLVNMVNENDLIKHNYWPYLYLRSVFSCVYVYMLKTECFVDFYMAYIYFKCDNKITAAFIKNVYI